jgi:hypothetical protein
MGSETNPFGAWIRHEKPMLVSEAPVEMDIPVGDEITTGVNAGSSQAGTTEGGNGDEVMWAEERADQEVINGVVDATSVLAEVPAFTPQVLYAFCTDVAQNVHTYAQIALRYGFVDVAQMAEFLRDQHVIRRRIKEYKAVWESDTNVRERIRELSGHAVLAALPTTAQIMLDAKQPANTRIDAVKQHAIMAGAQASGIGAAAAGAGGGPSAAKFSIQIMFANSGKTETFTTIQAEPVNRDDRDIVVPP